MERFTKIGRIASKIKGGTKDERLAVAKELNLLAEFLIDMYGDEGTYLLEQSKRAAGADDGQPLDAN